MTRRLNLLAGQRPPLPGHYHLRETNLRLELAACFEPANAIEMLWVADIAYCTAAMEMYRAQIAGFRMRALKTARSEYAHEGHGENGVYSKADRQELAALAARNFQAEKNEPVLANSSFATLLGHNSREDLTSLRLLQQLLHDETKERDRLVNLRDRRRRLAARDVIEWAEAKERAAQVGLDGMPATDFSGFADDEPEHDNDGLVHDPSDPSDPAEADEADVDEAA